MILLILFPAFAGLFIGAVGLEIFIESGLQAWPFWVAEFILMLLAFCLSWCVWASFKGK